MVATVLEYIPLGCYVHELAFICFHYLHGRFPGKIEAAMGNGSLDVALRSGLQQ